MTVLNNLAICLSTGCNTVDAYWHTRVECGCELTCLEFLLESDLCFECFDIEV